jgi:demethylmenaquinone methyltransferase/2-methoxy-6-polyprenyl-1,4-benzoquinol methylase
MTRPGDDAQRADSPHVGACATGLRDAGACPSGPRDPGARDPARVRAMFDRLARRYRCANRVITFGRDRAWRLAVIRAAGLPPGGRLLDVGAGTGDLALTARAGDPRLRTVAIDFAGGMLAAGRRADPDSGILWCCGDARRLPFRDSTFDAAVSGYLLRNVPDPAEALREQVRVVRPGGRVICLETAPPRAHRERWLTGFYLRRIMPVLGWLVTGDRRAYGYLGDTTEAFLAPDELGAQMRAAGLDGVTWSRGTLGVVAIHTGVRRAGL